MVLHCCHNLTNVSWYAYTKRMRAGGSFTEFPSCGHYTQSQYAAAATKIKVSIPSSRDTHSYCSKAGLA